MSKTTILIDADVLAFESSIIAQENIQWEEELWTVHADMTVAKERVIGRIEQFKDLLKADEVVLALSDRANFRRKLFPDYKSNRRKSVLPIILKPMKEWMINELNAQLWANIEADDVLSILATEYPNRQDKRIIVSIDKDFKGVPGIFYDYNRQEYHQPTEEEADNFHLVQTLMGDSTDGFSGVKGVGPVAAERWLDENGYTWESVVALYEKKGQTEQDALINAWMARLLRKEQYNKKQKQITKLWTPKNYQTADKRRITTQVHSVTGLLDEDDSALFLQSPFDPLPNDLKTEGKCTETTTGITDSHSAD
jgi:5'-3' exonuclease